MRTTVKAKIETIGIGSNAETYLVSVNFPEFPAPGGTTQILIFEATLDDYQNWTPPDGVTKNPSNYVEYEFIRPAYQKLNTIHGTLKPLIGKEYDW